MFLLKQSLTEGIFPTRGAMDLAVSHSQYKQVLIIVRIRPPPPGIQNFQRMAEGVCSLST